MKSILPQDNLFFQKFEDIARAGVQAAEGLVELVQGGDPTRLARRIKALEHEADEAVHATLDHLHRSFITPLDRSDIHSLVGELDNVVDLIDASASRIDLYRPKEIIPEAQALAVVVLDCAKALLKLTQSLPNLKKNADAIDEMCKEVNRYEDEADAIRRSAMARLFREEKDPFELIKWKEILQLIEEATDRGEDVADLVEGIVLENT